MKRFLLSCILAFTLFFYNKANAQTVSFENFTSVAPGSNPTGWTVNPNTSVNAYNRPGSCSVGDKGLGTPGVGKSAPTGFITQSFAFNPSQSTIVINFKVFVFDANLKCSSAKNFDCDTYVQVYLVPVSYNDALGTPTGADLYGSLPNYQILYANANNTVIFNSVSLPAGVTSYRLLFNFKTASGSNCTSNGTKFIFDDFGFVSTSCSGNCPPIANDDYFNSDLQSLFSPGTSFKGNVFGGYALWSTQATAGYSLHSLGYSPAVSDGVDYDLLNTNLSSVTFTKVSDPVVVTSNAGCGSLNPGTVTFNNDGTFTYFRGSICVTRVSFTYKISRSGIESNVAKVIIDMPGQEISLPVHFKSFNADRKNTSTISLKWTTATEQNNRGFYVQRNIGGEWKNIAFVFSQADGGNSSSELSYEYFDANLEKGISQYRIQQVDMDSKATYSDIRAVRGEGSANKVSVYPNPSTDGKVNLVFENGTSLRDVQVADLQGRIVKTYKEVKGNILVVDKLTSGFYTLKITDRNTAVSSVEKVVVK